MKKRRKRIKEIGKVRARCGMLDSKTVLALSEAFANVLPNGEKRIGLFKSYFPSEYATGRNLGILEEMRDFFPDSRKPPNYWRGNKERILEEGNKYENMSDFMMSSPSAYDAARKHDPDLRPNIEKKMKALGHRYKRAIYAFEFQDRSVYVGLTYSYEERYKDHMKRTKVIIAKASKMNFEFIKFHKFYELEEAKIQEQKAIDGYRKRGWKILNKARAGILGCTNIRWTEEKIINTSYSFEYLADFQKAYRGAYGAASKMRILHKLNHLKQKKIKWSKNNVIKSAKKAKSEGKCKSKWINKGEISHATRNGYVSEIDKIFYGRAGLSSAEKRLQTMKKKLTANLEIASTSRLK